MRMKVDLICKIGFLVEKLSLDSICKVGFGVEIKRLTSDLQFVCIGL